MSDFNRGTGLLVIEVCGSNPNGDPDSEGEPRMLSADRRGLISPVSFKRKLRDLVSDETGQVWKEAEAKVKIGASQNGRRYKILESRGRKREEIWNMRRNEFVDAYWDARTFGNTFLESMKDQGNKEGSDSEENQTTRGRAARKSEGNKEADDKEHFISTGAVQFGPGLSIAPIEIEYQTWTNKAGVEGDKDRGMAPLAWRFVLHAIYAMPFFVNPLVARKSGCSASDIELLKFLVPFAYSATSSVARPNVQLLHAWYAEQKSALGSCPDYLVIDAMTPIKKEDPEQPSRSRADYLIPKEKDLPPEVRSRLLSFEDLCTKDWPAARM